MSERDPRFLGGEDMVLTDTRDTALTLVVNYDGTCDVTAHIDKIEAARILRQIADGWDPAPCGECGGSGTVPINDGPFRRECTCQTESGR